MPFNVTILGCNSALPTANRNPSAQILDIKDQLYLIDCGEGTQMQMRKFKIKFNKINHIFISHLHGDHFFGLIGLLSTFGLMNRKSDLHIYAHSEIQTILKGQLSFMKSDMTYRIVFHPLDFKKSKIILEDKRITVTSFPLLHRIPTCGFLFAEKSSLPHLIKEKLDQYAIPIADRVKIKAGADFITFDRQIIPNSELVIPAVKPCSYAYCSDTAYKEDIIPIINGTDVLYHEATFGSDNKSLATITGHSTATDAATIALKAKVGQLIIGHFSARYKEVSGLLSEARKTFPNTEAAVDGKTFFVKTSLG